MDWANEAASLDAVHLLSAALFVWVTLPPQIHFPAEREPEPEIRIRVRNVFRPVKIGRIGGRVPYTVHGVFSEPFQTCGKSGRD